MVDRPDLPNTVDGRPDIATCVEFEVEWEEAGTPRGMGISNLGAAIRVARHYGGSVYRVQRSAVRELVFDVT